LFHKKQSTPQKFKQSPKFVILTLNKEKYLKFCHIDFKSKKNILNFVILSVAKYPYKKRRTDYLIPNLAWIFLHTNYALQNGALKRNLCGFSLWLHLASCYVVFFTKGSIRQNLSLRELSKAKFVAKHKQR